MPQPRKENKALHQRKRPLLVVTKEAHLNLAGLGGRFRLLWRILGAGADTVGNEQGETDQSRLNIPLPPGYDPPHAVDTMSNMGRRNRIALAETPHLSAIFEHLRERCVAMPGNPLHRVYKCNSRPYSC